MSIITITSEWNNWDYYLASLKAKLTALCEDVKIVDIMHSIKPFDIMGAAFIIKSCFHHFPTNTIHIICVDSDLVKYPVLAIKYKDHFFIGSDNGVFSLLFQDEILEIQEIPVLNTSTSFIELDVFIDIAVKLYKKQPFGNIGRPIQNLNKRTLLIPSVENKTITGSVIYIDSYNNAITNITKELFAAVRKENPFIIYVASNHYKIKQINIHYRESPMGELLALFNSVGLLEIAINSGKVCELLNLVIGSSIRIIFNKEEKQNVLDTKKQENHFTIGF